MSRINFSFGLRGKSVFIAFISSFIIIAFFLLYAIPEQEKQAVASLKKASERHLKTLAIVVTSPLLKRQYAYLHEILDAEKDANKHWKSLKLITGEGLMVYPLIAEGIATGENEIAIETDIIFLDQKLGTLSLISNIADELKILRLQIYKNILAILILLLIQLIIILLFIDNKITSPLAKLNHAFNQLSQKEFNYALPEYRKDEVGEVINGFKVMREKIFNHQAEMNDLLEVEKKMTQELRGLMKEVEAARSKAEKASEAKSQFLSSMSHELRTPMNAILGFAQLLEMNDEHNLSAEQLENIEEIMKAGKHLLNLINEVLDLSKIEAGELNISMESIQFSRIIKECIVLISPLAAQNQISIFNNIDPNMDYYLHADHIRIKQVLLNLLSNAVKYNRKQGNITITTEEIGNDRLKVFIRDTGHGLTEEQQQKLFQPFERLDSEFSEIEGAGIGLVICKRLIELMGGEIGLNSAPNIGSTFWIELAVSKQTAQQTVIETPNFKNIPADKAVLLYVEDNPANLKVIEQLVNKLDFVTLITAPTPHLGLELAQAHQPDLILLDINLPEMDGYELLRRLRTFDYLKETPIVAISANATSKDINKGLDAGFIDYLTKPIDIAQFYKMINRFISH